MTKKLESLFDLADEEPDVDTEEAVDALNHITDPGTDLTTALQAVDKIDAALPTIRDLETSDTELDDIANTARNTFQDLMDLGMNVEARFAGEIFNNASKMLDTALSAKNNKINKKLKMIELQLKKAQLDLKKKQSGESIDAIEAEGVVMDRNALLDEILGKKA
jgi:hypothetical protein